MGGVAQLLFGGGRPAPQPVYIQQPGPAPTPPKEDDAAIEDAARKERVAQAQAVGRGNTILTDYALATTNPSVKKQTLGGA